MIRIPNAKEKGTAHGSCGGEVNQLLASGRFKGLDKILALSCMVAQGSQLLVAE